MTAVALVRSMKKDDEIVVAEIIRQVLEEYHLDVPGTAYFDPQLDYMYDYYQPLEGSNYWVLEEASRVVGGIGISLLAESVDGLGKVAEVQKLYLLPEVRGRGYAKQLMATLMAFASSHGYQYLYLETIHSLAAAINLYEKLGFDQLTRPIVTQDHHPLMDVFMGKKIS